MTATSQLATQHFEGLSNPPAEQIQSGSLHTSVFLPSSHTTALQTPEHLLAFDLLGQWDRPRCLCSLHTHPCAMQHCCCPWSYRRGCWCISRSLSVHKVKRCHQKSSLVSVSSLPFFIGILQSPLCFQTKQIKFNYFVMCLSEQAPTRLTGIKHLLYTMFNQNLFRFKTMCVVK